MTQAAFMRCEAVTLHWEGGFVDHPQDKGGPTNKGITLRALSEFVGRPATLGELLHMSDALVAQVYHLYWAAVRGDELPVGVDMMLFDCAVNSGRRRAVAITQTALGFATADGAIGDVTMAAIRACEPRDLIKRQWAARETFLRGLPNFATFGRGWITRVDAIAAQALGWALTQPST